MRESAVRRPWGHYVDHKREREYVMKTMHFIPDMVTSLQSHYLRAEFWYVVSGSGWFIVNGQRRAIGLRDIQIVPVGAIHQIQAGPQGLVVAETQFGVNCTEDDIVRY